MMVLTPAATALAQRRQTPEDFAPPEAPPLTWAAWGLTVGFLVLIIALAAKNSKRTHLD